VTVIQFVSLIGHFNSRVFCSLLFSRQNVFYPPLIQKACFFEGITFWSNTSFILFAQTPPSRTHPKSMRLRRQQIIGVRQQNINAALRVVLKRIRPELPMKNVSSRKKVAVRIDNWAHVIVNRAIINVPGDFGQRSAFQDGVLRTVNPDDCFGVSSEVYLESG
jgi:hypothetical protein